MERVSQFKFLGVSVSEELTWSTNIMLAVGKAQRHLHLKKLRNARIPQQLVMNFYHCATSSVLTYGFLVWFSVYTTRWPGRAHSILPEQHRPAHHLFQLLPSARRHRPIRSRSTRLAHRLLNEQPTPHLRPQTSHTPHPTTTITVH